MWLLHQFHSVKSRVLHLSFRTHYCVKKRRLWSEKPPLRRFVSWKWKWIRTVCPTLGDSMEAHQASLSMGFSRQAYWSGLPFSSPGELPNPEIELRSPTLQADSLPSEPPGNHIHVLGEDKSEFESTQWCRWHLLIQAKYSSISLVP